MITDKDKLHAALHQPLNEDLPGLGQYFCVYCNKHHENATALAQHTKGKPHKKRLKRLDEQPYSQAEAEAAAGLNVVRYVARLEQQQQQQQQQQDVKMKE